MPIYLAGFLLISPSLPEIKINLAHLLEICEFLRHNCALLMDSRKIIVGSYLAISALIWFLVRSFVQWLSFTFYQVRKIPGADVIREALPVVAGVLAFVILIRNTKVNEVLEDVVSELKKVTWPNFEDVKKSTIVVMVCILLASGILAVFDLVFGKVVGFLLS